MAQLTRSPTPASLLRLGRGYIGAEYLTAKPGYSAAPDMKLVVQLGVFALVGILISWRVHASETQRNRLLLQLRERVKELTVLHRATRVLQKQGDTRTLLEEFVGLVPGGWRFPEVAAARVSFRDIEVVTANFHATPTVTVKTAGGSARVQVADTGMGIDPVVLPRIFDPFWKAETSASPSTTGLGLGLSIVRRLVELHGGTIEAQSEGSGRGTTMTVTLPLATDFVGAVLRLERPARHRDIC